MTRIPHGTSVSRASSSFANPDQFDRFLLKFFASVAFIKATRKSKNTREIAPVPASKPRGDEPDLDDRSRMREGEWPFRAPERGPS